MAEAHRAQQIRKAAWKLALIVLVLLTVWLLDPRREMPLEDDWAYARTVESLLHNGQYQLHPWISANMPFQAVWGAMFALLLGPGFGSLRISTLILSGAGLFACYKLLKADGRSEAEACLGTLVLWSSPLYLRFSFTFMTDVPFTALVLLSLWLYAKAWTQMSHRWMAVAAMAGTAAILTRQFAVAIIPALLLVGWMRRSAPKTASLAAVAVIPLILAAAYQVASGLLAPTWAQQITLRAQHLMMSNWRELLEQLLWRPGILLQYLCLFTLPLSLGVIVQLAVDRTPVRHRVSTGFVRLCFIAAAVSGVSLAVGLATHKDSILPRIPWNLEGLDSFGALAPRILTVVTLIAAVPLTALLAATVRRDFLAATTPSSAPPIAALIHTTMICLLPMTLIYNQFGDEYLLVYVPWTIWTIGRAVSLRGRSAILCVAGMILLQLAVVVPWVDYIMTYNQVQWEAAQIAVERFKIPPTKVYAGWTWDCYYAFDDYAARFPAAGQTNFDTLFVQWLPAMEKQAEYRVKVGYRTGSSVPGKIDVARRRTLLGRVMEAKPVRVPE